MSLKAKKFVKAVQIPIQFDKKNHNSDCAQFENFTELIRLA